MQSGIHAGVRPDSFAVIMARSGETMTYAELDARSNQLAQTLYREGIRPGDQLALCLENSTALLVTVWAAQRSGLNYTPISTRLPPDEVAEIAEHCGARALIVSGARPDLLAGLDERAPAAHVRLVVGAASGRWHSYATATSDAPTMPLESEFEGVEMLSRAGTIAGTIADNIADNAVDMTRELSGCDENSVFLTTAPLYYRTPLMLGMAVHCRGGTLVVMEDFVAIDALECIELYRVTHSHWVTTMFVRLLELTAELRARFDLSTHVLAIHGTAPCPAEVRTAMIDWWGPILVARQDHCREITAAS